MQDPWASAQSNSNQHLPDNATEISDQAVDSNQPKQEREGSLSRKGSLSTQDVPTNGATQSADDLSEPSPMSAAPKAPTKKALEKSLKRSKAAPQLLPTVISKTRPKDLPPKPKEEDQKHLKEYTEMVQLSKVVEKKRQESEEVRRLRKESEAEAQLPAWESEIIPNWKAVLDDAKLRKMWWQGTMPPRFRANLWTSCIGNALMIGKSSFSKSLAQAKNLVATDRMPQHVMQFIGEDIAITLPQTKLFQTGGPLAQDLLDLLMASSVFWKDKPAYASGVSFVAALLLISMPVQSAFVALVNLINNTFLKYFYEHNQEFACLTRLLYDDLNVTQMDAYDRVFTTLLADFMPDVYHNFIANDVKPSLYLHPWLTSAFAYFLPLDCATRIMDIFLLEGDSFFFRVALAILQTMEARLFNPDQDELAGLFKAKDRGARLVVAREKANRYGLLPNDPVEVWPEEVYTQCGATEDAIFAAIEGMTMWREATWQRIVDRELPD